MGNKYLFFLVVFCIVSLCFGAKTNGSKSQRTKPPKGVIKPSSTKAKNGNIRFRHVLNKNLLNPDMEPNDPFILYVMLNPSTADEENDDPTTRKLGRITSSNGYYNYKIRNLFAARATKPIDLINWLKDEMKPRSKKPIANDNRSLNRLSSLNWTNDLKRAAKIVMAWGGDGAKPSIKGRRNEVSNYLERHYNNKLCYMALTESEEPRHPLYLGIDLSKFKKWSNRNNRDDAIRNRQC
jgi:hypothetical protein